VRWREILRGASWHGLRVRWLARALILVSLVGGYLRIRDAGLTLLFWSIVIPGLLGTSVEAWVFISRRIRLRDRERIQQLVQAPEVKISVIEELIGLFSGALKATTLHARMTADNLKPRVVAFLYVEGDLGALLDIGAREGVEVGTPLLAYKVDPDGEFPAEFLLCCMRVTYVQAWSNLAQARIVYQVVEDRGYWADVRKDLRHHTRVPAPRNLLVPHIQDEISGMSSETLRSLISHLEQVRNSLRASMHTSQFEGGKDGP
jgi:hypothetical protein